MDKALRLFNLRGSYVNFRLFSMNPPLAYTDIHSRQQPAKRAKRKRYLQTPLARTYRLHVSPVIPVCIHTGLPAIPSFNITFDRNIRVCVTPSHAYSAGQNSVADLLLASDPALLVSAPALALVAGATNLSKMAAQCFLFHSFVPFMPHFKTQIDTTDTSSPPCLSVGSLACLWHARLFGTRLITARGLVINQGHVERDSRGPPVFQTIPPLSPVSHFRWPVLQVQGWAKGFSFLIN